MGDYAFSHHELHNAMEFVHLMTKKNTANTIEM